jgi:hypothetical protein
VFDYAMKNELENNLLNLLKEVGLNLTYELLKECEIEKKS